MYTYGFVERNRWCINSSILRVQVRCRYSYIRSSKEIGGGGRKKGKTRKYMPQNAKECEKKCGPFKNGQNRKKEKKRTSFVLLPAKLEHDWRRTSRTTLPPEQRSLPSYLLLLALPLSPLMLLLRCLSLAPLYRVWLAAVTVRRVWHVSVSVRNETSKYICTFVFKFHETYCARIVLQN